MEQISAPIAVCETPEFLSRAEKVWSADERSEFVDFIARNPEAGDLIQGTGGVRKVRWRKAGVGKSGGVRVIYYFYNETIPLYLVSLFAKNQKSDLSAGDKQDLAKFVKTVKATARGDFNA